VPVSIGVVNDGSFLYVALGSSDEQISRSVFHRGMLVRIRPKGGTELGIEFPVGTPDPHGGRTHTTTGGESPSFLLYEAGSKEGQRISVDNPFGLEMKASLDNNHLTYELKVPLIRSAQQPYCLDAAPGETIAFEIENPEEHRVDAGGPMGGGRGGGESGGGHQHGGGSGGMGEGMGSMGGGHHGSSGGMERGEDGSSSSHQATLHVKAKLKLASAPPEKP
jgi:hypothetical protein